jgi:hypothetical protein
VIEVVDPYLQISEIDLHFGETECQCRHLALQGANPADNLVQLLTLRGLFRADRSQHAQDKVGSFVAQKKLAPCDQDSRIIR